VAVFSDAKTDVVVCPPYASKSFVTLSKNNLSVLLRLGTTQTLVITSFYSINGDQKQLAKVQLENCYLDVMIGYSAHRHQGSHSHKQVYWSITSNLLFECKYQITQGSHCL
jgi:hypothetical protein